MQPLITMAGSMKQVQYEWNGSQCPSQPSGRESALLRSHLAHLRQVIEKEDWSDPAASILLPGTDLYLKQSQALARRLGKPALTIVVGIGGSNLGTLAVTQACRGRYHNLFKPLDQVVFADTVDGASLQAILDTAQAHLQAGHKVVLNGITKSGTTLETAVNFELLVRQLGAADSGKLSVVVTSDEGSKLEAQAEARGFHTLSIPKMVGGRYSVLSNVGLFPIALCGLDAAKLVAGAKAARERCLDDDLAANPASRMAHFLSFHRGFGKTIHDHFLFSNSLQGLGYWYRQLMGESVGKEHDLDGKEVNAGITPTVSIGSTDLHSMAQLYLAGPRDKTFRFVTLDRPSTDPGIPASKELESLLPHAGGRPASELMAAIWGGVQAAFRARYIPYTHITLPDAKESSIGQVMQAEMVEMMLLARLMNVNAFDQPAVEEYKSETRRLLKAGK